VHTNEVPIHVLPVGGALWVTTFDGGTLQRIDPATNTVTATVDVGDGADGLLQHEGSLWVTTDRANTVVRVDPSGPSVVRVWDVGTQPHNGVFANGSLWTAAFDDGQLLRLHLP
jgi:YVTN family beta-propeller protein